jgi:hypothetical protein
MMPLRVGSWRGKLAAAKGERREEMFSQTLLAMADRRAVREKQTIAAVRPRSSGSRR